MSAPLGPKGGSAGPTYLTGWDLGILGGERIPGKCRITKGGVKVKKDPKRKAGADGARPTLHGMDPGAVDFEVTVWTEEQLERLIAWCDRFLPRQGVRSAPYLFQHEQLRSMGPSVMVTVESGSELQLAPELGPFGRRLQVHCDHWLPPSGKGAKTATATPVRAVRNVRREDAQRRNPSNPLPTEQAAAAHPTGQPALDK